MSKQQYKFISVGIEVELVKWLDDQYPLAPRAALIRQWINERATQEGYPTIK